MAIPGWLMVAFVNPDLPARVIELDPGTTVEFGDGVRLMETETWMRDDSILVDLGLHEREVIGRAQYVLTADFLESQESTAALEASEPDARRTPFQRIAAAVQSMWLARPSGVGTSVALTLRQREANEWEAVGVLTKRPPLVPHERDVEVVMTAADLGRATEVFSALRRTPSESAAWVANALLWRALHEHWFEGRYLLMWIGLEALFSPQTGESDSTHQLAERMALFLHGRGQAAKSAFSRIKKAYGVRSHISHGRRLKTLIKQEAGPELLADTERWIREAICIVLLNPGLTEVFVDSDRRNEYLRNLVLADERD